MKRGRFSCNISRNLPFSLVFSVFRLYEKHTKKATREHKQRKRGGCAQNQPDREHPHAKQAEKAKEGAYFFCGVQLENTTQKSVHDPAAVKALNGNKIEQAQRKV